MGMPSVSVWGKYERFERFQIVILMQLCPKNSGIITRPSVTHEQHSRVSMLTYVVEVNLAALTAAQGLSFSFFFKGHNKSPSWLTSTRVEQAQNKPPKTAVQQQRF